MQVQETALPATPEDFTAEWLTHALGREVSSVELAEVVWGTATKVRLELTYADQAGDTVPRALCAKGGFDERLAEWGLGSAYVREAQFFGDLATGFGGVPRCWYAGIDPAGGQGVVLLDDLVATGCSFGDPTSPWSPDEVAAALEVQAGWHAGTAAARADLPGWLEVGSSAPRGAATMFLSRDRWDSHFAQEGAPVLPSSLQEPDRILRAFQRLWADDDAAAHCAVHGDAHLGNTYRDAHGRPGFLDWQTVCLGPWAYDVAYFIGGALSIEDRRAHERELLDGYLEAFAAAGGPLVGMDVAWPDYVRHTLHGILWAATPAVMQPLERIVAMAERYAAAIEDHDTLRELGC